MAFSDSSTSHPNVWFPFTSMKDMPAFPRVKRGEGSWLYTEDGTWLLDLISSWWVNLHGHTQPEIAEAIYNQALELEQVIFAELSHRPAEEVAERLAAHLPGELNKVFYSDNGSTAVEIGLKISYQHWMNRGEKRQTFIGFEGAYHGDTIGAMSVGARSVFTDVFQDLLFDVDRVPYPATWWEDKHVDQKEGKVLEKIETLLRENPDRYAGIIIEPLLQGAGGMRMCREGFLQQLRKLASRYNTLLIFDEVLTGFGRTGDWFACRRAWVEPDIVCLAKGLTGGFLPLAATVTSDEIFESFLSDDPMTTFYHGHSYTANPLGCAAALKSMDLLEANELQFRGLEDIHREQVALLAELPHVHRPRVTGTVAAVDIQVEGEEGYLSQVGQVIRRKAQKSNLLLRPLGNILYILPPYCIGEEELKDAYATISLILDEVGR